MSNSIEDINKKIELKQGDLDAIRLQQEELNRQFSDGSLELHSLWRQKHFSLREEFPLDYETDRAALNDLVAYAKSSGSGVTLLRMWIDSFDVGNEKGISIDWNKHVPIQGEMPEPQIFVTHMYGEVDYDAKSESISRLARAINVNGEARFSIVLTPKRGISHEQDYMVSGENYDQWRLAPGRYEMNDPLLVPNPSYSLPVLLKELYEQG